MARENRRGGGPLAFLFKLLIVLLIILALGVLILYFTPEGVFITEKEGEPLEPSTKLGTQRANILLLGVDMLNNNAQRSDTILILSVGGGELRLASILRDTMADIPEHGRAKINAAYAYGGAQLTARTINRNFGLNVTRYAVVDFKGVAEIINAMGGVDISINESEQNEINRNLRSSWKYFRRLGYSSDATKPLSYSFAGAGEDGTIDVHLDGFQALAYARIRRTDSDFTRAFRQRKLISAMLRRAKSLIKNPAALYRTAKAVADNVDTDLSLFEIASLGVKCALSGDYEHMRMPVDGTYTDDGSALRDIDYGANLSAFIEFAY